jgi:hypothetical protein
LIAVALRFSLDKSASSWLPALVAGTEYPDAQCEDNEANHRGPHDQAANGLHNGFGRLVPAPRADRRNTHYKDRQYGDDEGEQKLRSSGCEYRFRPSQRENPHDADDAQEAECEKAKPRALIVLADIRIGRPTALHPSLFRSRWFLAIGTTLPIRLESPAAGSTCTFVRNGIE